MGEKENFLSSVTAELDRIDSVFENRWYVGNYTMALLFTPRGKIPEKVEYENATLQFSVTDLARLSEEQLKKLKQEFYSKTNMLFEKNGMPMNFENIKKFIDPNLDTNIIQHELEHAQALPVEMQDKAKINITFLDDSDGKLLIAGVMLCDYALLTNKQNAIVSSAPKSLGSVDVDQAISFAKDTRDILFMLFIKKRISSRKKH